ncbi:MAG: PD40 domain-containing protein [Salinivirgaceae bacterium]|nr:PD40 domain-containing protein [Salinivirgaceae bacterium]
MNKLLKAITTFALLVAAVVADAQHEALTTTNSERAKSYYYRAKGFFNRRDFANAEIEINKAIAADERFLEAYLLKAELCNDGGFNECVIESLLAARAIDSTFYPYLDYNLAGACYENGQYVDAKYYYSIFLTNSKANAKSKELAQQYINKCQVAIEFVNHPVPFEPKSLGPDLELPYEQYWPSLSLDGKTLVFTMMLPDSLHFRPDGSIMMQEDFYVTRFIDGKWEPAVPIGAPINTTGNEGAQQISADGNTLVFTGCNRRDGYGKCDIYFAKKNIYGQWGRPYNAGGAINAASADKQPCLSPDGRFLYFSSDRAGGLGKMDIWVSELDANGRWGKPKNLGAPINTPGDDICPFIHPDNQTLYFSSDGHPGLGRKDIFMSRLDSAGHWTEPVNLGYPINSHRDEIGLVVDNKGVTAYFSSNINSDTKNIYTFELPEAVRPTPVSYVSGLVTDAQTNLPLNARVQLLNLPKGDTVMSVKTGADGGDFLVSLPVGRQYAMLATSPGYLFNSQHFNLTETHSVTKPYVVNIKLEKPQVGANTILRNIFFKFDSYELMPQSFVELNQMAVFIKNSAGVKFEIGGHTDNVGNDAYNQQLSEKRAKSVYDYLISQGVGQSQLSFKGYGKQVPIGDNSTAEGREQNRRTELKVVE